MRKWFIDSLLPNVLVNLLLWGSGAGVMVGLLAYLQHFPWFVIVLSTISAISLVLFGINQLYSIRERNKKSITKFSDKEVEDLIHKWVDIPAFSCRRLDDESIYFNFVLTDSYKRNVNIVRNKKEPDSINIITKLTLNSNNKITQNTWDDLIGKLNTEMARLGIQYSFETKNNGMTPITLIESMFIDDSLTEFYFRQRILFVIRALVLVQAIYKETLNKNKSNKV